MDQSERSKNETLGLNNQSEASSNNTMNLNQLESFIDFDQSESSNNTASSRIPRFLDPDIERLRFWFENLVEKIVYWLEAPNLLHIHNSKISL